MHETEVTKDFAQDFDGVEEEIGDIKLILTKSIVAETTILPKNGESWFKNRKNKENDFIHFLREPSMDIAIFKKRIPVTALKGKWRNLLLVIQKFVTYDGSFGTMIFYHARLLMHFINGNEINLPHFLLQSLKCSSLKLFPFLLPFYHLL